MTADNETEVAFLASHATPPPGGWINDPNALIQHDDGSWTLFVQHAEHAPYKSIGWARLTSVDLVHWTWLGVAIPPSAEGYAYSGSVAAKGDMLTAWLTRAHRDGGQSQVRLTSNDRGATWRDEVALSGASGRNVRDPFRFVRPDGETGLLIAEPCDWHGWRADPRSVASVWHQHGDTLTRVGTIGPWSPPGVMWEVPALVDFADRQLLIVSTVDRRDDAARCAVRYWVGRFDGLSFTPDEAGGGRLLDHGPDFYAAIPSVGADDPYIVAWASSWATARKLDWPGGIHGGPISLPRRLTLDGNIVRQSPVAGVEFVPLIDWVPGEPAAATVEGGRAQLHVTIDADGLLMMRRQSDDPAMRWSGEPVRLDEPARLRLSDDAGLVEIFVAPQGLTITAYLG